MWGRQGAVGGNDKRNCRENASYSVCNFNETFLGGNVPPSLFWQSAFFSPTGSEFISVFLVAAQDLALMLQHLN